ncbi:aminoacyl-histidine dipeptidase [Oceanirhabdus sp. W0125-5]|uniref:aminoacyl-histidine dipeptidase n=1 Tax=Oceanirhabdus sp. W0125-5 TaxID=2999116 RepID=UPI0022F2D630|nr:aminoacyl-histidine dipeptidase [Oceanirhabdus sp. W0125-5]WBW99059.1 aminoacyl-histidine dipeptidase [Oceanirhabdus sp. W0125-5]
MLENLNGLKSYNVFEIFKKMNEIPRGSGNEKAISDWLVTYALDRELEVIQDEALNIIIKKPATKGYENSPGVVIQGHMDMVCEKNKGTKHDFEKDPIKFIVEGNKLRADGTTLGADNGIAVAYGLALLDDENVEHPELELLFTTEEETGMDGALALNPDSIKGNMLINIDSEEEGTLLVSCAGGVRQVIELDGNRENVQGKGIKIEIRGLKGGHSGMDINKERGNSNKLISRILNDLRKEMKVRINNINGGSKMNAIPRECDCTIIINENNIDKAVEIINDYDNIFKKELSASDNGIQISFKNVDVTDAFTIESTNKIIDMLLLIPNGIQSMSMQIDGLVESSTNIGVCVSSDSKITFVSAIRSSVESRKWEIAKRGDALCNLLGASVEYQSAYPAWQYKENSKLRDRMVSVYENMYGNKPNISAIHAGLECGLFGGKFGERMDMISFGPNLHDVHTPNEWVEISSVDRGWDYLLSVLKSLK